MPRSLFVLLASPVLTILLCNPCRSSVSREPSVDGIRLGMSDTDVLHVANVRGQKLIRNRQLCLSEILAKHQHIVSPSSPGECLAYLSYRYAGGELKVWFLEDLPSHPGKTRVSEIALNFATNQKIFDRILTVVGPPTVTDRSVPWKIAEWCFDYACNRLDQALSDPKAGETLLVNRDNALGLTLFDNRVNNKLSRELSQALDRRGVKLQP